MKPSLQGLIESDVIAKEYRPATAITDPSQIDGLVAISDLPANQVVVSNQFVSQAESLSTFSSLLKNNEVAVTISTDQIRGVAGLLVPGDFVNLLVTVPRTAATERGRRRRVVRCRLQPAGTGAVPEGPDPGRGPDPQAGARRDGGDQPRRHAGATRRPRA